MNLTVKYVRPVLFQGPSSFEIADKERSCQQDDIASSSLYRGLGMHEEELEEHDERVGIDLRSRH